MLQVIELSLGFRHVHIPAEHSLKQWDIHLWVWNNLRTVEQIFIKFDIGKINKNLSVFSVLIKTWQ
jgi:hypothetical protein